MKSKTKRPFNELLCTGFHFHYIFKPSKAMDINLII